MQWIVYLYVSLHVFIVIDQSNPDFINIDEYIKIENKNNIFLWMRTYLFRLYQVRGLFNVLNAHSK